MLVSLVRVEWLIDSIYIHKRMKEEDYFIRSFKNKDSTMHFEEKQNNTYFNSMSHHSFGVNRDSMPTMLNNRKSISVSAVKANQKVKHPR